MPASNKDDFGKVDNVRVEYDDKQRALDLYSMKLTPPAAGIFGEPTRCYKLNDEWSKIIMGFVSWLAATPVWKDAENEGYSAIENILRFMEGGICMDCEGVEDCLETSTIILLVQAAIVTNLTNIEINNNNIITNATQINNLIATPPDGNVYPPPPNQSTDPDPACGAAYYCVQKVRDWIAEVEGYPVTYPTIFDAMEALLTGNFSLSVIIVQALLANVYTIPAPPSILPDYDAQLDEMREQLYCSGFDKPSFAGYVRTALTNGAKIADYIDGVALVTWQRWYSTGMLDLTQDCSAYCVGTWCYNALLNEVSNWSPITSSYGCGSCFIGISTTELTGCMPCDVSAYHIHTAFPVVAGTVWDSLEIDIEWNETRESLGNFRLLVDGVEIHNEGISGTGSKTIILGAGSADVDIDFWLQVPGQTIGDGGYGNITGIRIKGGSGTINKFGINDC